MTHTVRRHDRESAIGALPIDRASHDEVMTAPTVVGPLAVAGESAAEIAGRKSGDVIREAEAVHGGLESAHALADFRQ